MNKNFLKEAIADAKAVKEAAIANAKLTLEETFTPHLKTMLSAKLQEMESEETELAEEVQLDEETIDLNETETTEAVAEQNEVVTEQSEEETEEEEVEIADMSKEDLEAMIVSTVQDMVSSGEIDLNADEEAAVEDEIEAGEGDEEIDLELDAEEEVALEETEVTTEACSTETTEESVSETKDKDLKAELEETKNQLFEAYKTVKTLKSSLNEINLLNAKLLYSGKILRSKSLNEAEKTKVVGAFDKAKTINEVKLVFETLTESLSKKSLRSPLKEHILGSASKTLKPIVEQKQEIVNTDEMVLKWQKLAGII